MKCNYKGKAKCEKICAKVDFYNEAVQYAECVLSNKCSVMEFKSNFGGNTNNISGACWEFVCGIIIETYSNIMNRRLTEEQVFSQIDLCFDVFKIEINCITDFNRIHRGAIVVCRPIGNNNKYSHIAFYLGHMRCGGKNHANNLPFITYANDFLKAYPKTNYQIAALEFYIPAYV